MEAGLTACRIVTAPGGSFVITDSVAGLSTVSHREFVKAPAVACRDRQLPGRGASSLAGTAAVVRTQACVARLRVAHVPQGTSW
jgi:hypothetical protein